MTTRADDLIREIESAGEAFEWAGPAPEAVVAELEVALGARMPPSYRAFLLRYGAGGLQAQTGISGIYESDPAMLAGGSAYGDTVRARRVWGLPDHLVVIEQGDEHFPPMCLDTSRTGRDGEYPVVGFWVTSRTVSPDSFADFNEYWEHSLGAALDALRDGP